MFVTLAQTAFNSPATTANSGQFAISQIIMNDLIAPLGAGNVPGLNAYATLYRRYMVLGCDWEVKFVNSQAVNVIGCCIPSAQSIGNTYTYGISGTKNFQEVAITSSSGTAQGVLKSYTSMDQLFGQKITFDPSGYGAATGSSPSILAYLNIGVAPTQNA